MVDFTTTPSYTVDDASAQYAVRAANEMGGLGEAVQATVSDGIHSLDAPVSGDNAIYNLQGIRVSQPRQGIYIINGRKMVVR